MPLKVVKCDSCGKESEEIVNMDDKVVKCECGGNAEVQPSFCKTFRLMGSGWFSPSGKNG